MSRAPQSLVVPGAILLSTALLVANLSVVPSSLVAIAYYIPYILFVSVMALSWRFSRSRLFFIAGILAASHWAMAQYPANVLATRAQAELLHAIVSILLPLNILFLVVFKERGIFSLRGTIRFGIIIAQIGIVSWLLQTRHINLLPHLTQIFVFIEWLRQINLPQLALLGYLVASLALLLKFLLRPGALGSGVIGALLCSAFALNQGVPGIAATLYFTASGLILIIALVQYTYSMAFYDELTSLPGRRALNDQMMKLGTRYVIAMVDIDHFKIFNDKYGHDIGDQALRFVATKLAKVGGGGTAFRYGGEEFTLLFPGKSIDQIYKTVERLRANIAASHFALRGRYRPRRKPEVPRKVKAPPKQIAIMVSIGLAASDSREYSSQEVLKKADEALYRAKESGRNRVSR